NTDQKSSSDRTETCQAFAAKCGGTWERGVLDTDATIRIGDHWSVLITNQRVYLVEHGRTRDQDTIELVPSGLELVPSAHFQLLDGLFMIFDKTELSRFGQEQTRQIPTRDYLHPYAFKAPVDWIDMNPRETRTSLLYVAIRILVPRSSNIRHHIIHYMETGNLKGQDIQDVYREKMRLFSSDLFRSNERWTLPDST